MSIEREAKLAAGPDVVLPDLRNVVPGLAVGPSTFRHLDAVYYDTRDLALARSGVTLRSRTGEPGPTWTVKFPDGDDGPVLSRREITFDGALGKVPPAALDLVRAARRTQALGPVARVRTTRTEFTLIGDTGPVVTVCDDVVSAESDDVEAFVFREVEVELAGDGEGKGKGKGKGKGDEILGLVVGRLHEAGCRAEKRTVPKVVRALGERARADPDVVVGDIPKKAAVGELVTATFARSVSQLIRFDPGVRLGTDPEDLHLFRVATRRLRSDLRTFGPLLDPTWSTALRAELRWLDSTVGAARDVDVLRIRLEARVADLPRDDATSGRRLLSRLEEERGVARGRMLAMLSSERYGAILDSMVAAANAPLFAAEPAGLAALPARGLLADLVRKPWHRLQRAVKALTRDAGDEDLHRVRILAKRCRYCAEACAPLFGAEAEHLAERLADVQTVLGDHQDAVVAEAWLRSAAKAVPSVRFAAGQLVAAELCDRDLHRERFPKLWKKAAKPALRSWLD